MELKVAIAGMETRGGAQPLDLAWDAHEENLRAEAAQARREEFFAITTAAPHIGVTELAPHVTILPNLGMPIAERCDSDKFGVK